MTEQMKNDIATAIKEFDCIINMQTFTGINVKVPSELQQPAIELLELNEADPIVEDLMSLEPAKAIKVIGLVILSNFGLNNITRIEKMVKILKIMILGYLKDNVSYRETNEPEKELTDEEKKKAFFDMLHIMTKDDNDGK